MALSSGGEREASLAYEMYVTYTLEFQIIVVNIREYKYIYMRQYSLVSCVVGDGVLIVWSLLVEFCLTNRFDSCQICLIQTLRQAGFPLLILEVIFFISFAAHMNVYDQIASPPRLEGAMLIKPFNFGLS